MAQPYYSGAERIRRKDASSILAFFWFCGIVCGFILFSTVGSNFILLMRNISGISVSIVNLLCVTLAPIIISIAAECLHVLYLLYMVCFFKALGISFVTCVILSAFGSAGWLISFLLLFHDILLLPFLYFYWLRCLRNREKTFLAAHTIFMLIVVILIFSIDVCFILPFGTFLMNLIA